MIALLVLLLVVVGQLPALAQSAEPASPSPSPTPSPASSPLPDPPPVTNMGIWESFNTFLIQLEDVVLSVWPSTPESMKLATIIGQLHDGMPFAPWYLIATGVAYALTLLTILMVVKAWKLVKW